MPFTVVWNKFNHYLCGSFFYSTGTRGVLVRVLPLPMEILGWIVFVVAGLIILAVGKICERYFMFAFGKEIPGARPPVLIIYNWQEHDDR